MKISSYVAVVTDKGREIIRSESDGTWAVVGYRFTLSELAELRDACIKIIAQDHDLRVTISEDR